MKHALFLALFSLALSTCRDEPRRIAVRPLAVAPPPGFQPPPESVVQPQQVAPQQQFPRLPTEVMKAITQPATTAPVKTLPSPVGPTGAKPANVVEGDFEDRIRYLGFDIDKASVKPGDTFTVTLYFQALKEIQENWQVFMHVESFVGPYHRSHGDHFPVGGQHPTNRWKIGEVVKDTIELRLHPNFIGRSAKMWMGFYIGDVRLKVSRGFQDGADRLMGGLVPVEGVSREGKTLVVNYRKGPIAIDGELKEPDWQTAQSTGPFVSVRGAGAPKNKTEAKALWDAEGIYFAFECEDEDIKSTFTKRDDALWEQEAVEVFIDANGDEATYAEFQVSPAGVLFDAWFMFYGPPGNRGGDVLGYNPAIEVKTKVDGTLNVSTDVDKGWTVEMKIPWSAFKDVGGRAPKNGDQWRANLYRVDKPKDVQFDDGAWNVPEGDYHALHNFGILKFAGGPTSAPEPAKGEPKKPAKR